MKHFALDQDASSRMKQLPLFRSANDRHREFPERITYQNPRKFVRDLHAFWDSAMSQRDANWRLSINLWGEISSEHSASGQWIGVNCLCCLLALIDAVRTKGLYVQIYVTLLDSSVTDAILYPDTSAPLDLPTLKRVRRIVRFYESNSFVSLLQSAGTGVYVSPSGADFNDLLTQVGARPQRQHEFSSTMMPLSPLVDSPVQNTALAERLANVKNILRNQLYREANGCPRVDEEKQAERASTIFMFELVLK